MKSKFVYILMLVFVVLSACSHRGSETPPDGVVMVSFSFSTQENITRAGHTWNDNLDDKDNNNYDVPEQPEDYDSRIKVNSLRAFIYDNQGKYICEITNKTYFELENSVNIYRFLGEVVLTPEVYDRLKENDYDCRIMLVANSSLEAEPKDFGTETFSVREIAFPDGFIPMWGVTTTRLTLVSQQDLGTIYLLRSAAKVEVKLSNALVTAGYKIQSVTINKYAANGFWFPKGWNSVSVNNTTLLTHEGCYNPYENEEYSTINNSFARVDDTKHVIYLPEMNTANNVSMSVELSNGTSTFSFDDAIKFAQYSNGSATDNTFNVVRNHHYQYTIDKVNVGSSLDLTCVVQPWTLVKETWDYTDLPAASDDGHITWSDGNLQGNLVYFDASNPYATFTFGLSAPASATWRAEFVNKKGKQNAFRFTKVVNDAEVDNDADNPNYYMTGNVGEKVTLRVRYTNPNITENNEAYLRILVILSDGRIIQVSELLDEKNGQDGQEYIMVQTP